MFLTSIIDIHVGLSMREMNMMDMTKIGVQMIIIKKEHQQKNAMQVKMRKKNPK